MSDKFYMLSGPGWQTQPHATFEAAAAEAEAMAHEVERKAFIDALSKPTKTPKRSPIIRGEIGTWSGVKFTT
jgi:hypothetical protein